MRTVIEIDEALLAEAMAAAGTNTKAVTVNEALRRLVMQNRRRKAVEAMAGLGREGDFDAMREGRRFDRRR